MIINNPKYNSLPEQVEQNRRDIAEIKERTLQDVDDELSTQSTNAVQNKVITEALNTEEFERKQDVEDLEDADENLDNIKQNKNDDTLETTNKTIVGAINELNSNKQDNLTEAQQNAVNSGIDSTKVQQIETNRQDIADLKEEKASFFSSEDMGGSDTRLTLQGNTDTLFRSYTFTSKGRPFVFNYGINCVSDKYLLAFDIYVDGVKKTDVFMCQNLNGNTNDTDGNIYGSQVIGGIGAGTHTISVYVNNRFGGDTSTMYVRNYSRISTTIYEI